jgi:hypothetical protein
MGKAVEIGLNKAGSNVSGIINKEAGHYPLEQSYECCVSAVLKFLNNPSCFE